MFDLNTLITIQVLEKELKRQLNREREKHRTVDQKFKDLRDENERLRVQLADKPIVDSSNISQRQGHKKVHFLACDDHFGLNGIHSHFLIYVCRIPTPFKPTKIMQLRFRCLFLPSIKTPT